MGGDERKHDKDRDRAERKAEEKLEKGLEDSFPASDPPAVTRAPADKQETRRPPPDGADRKPPVTPKE